MIDTVETTVISTRMSDHIVSLRLNRPSKRNAINNHMLQSLASEVLAAEADGHVRCLILTGGPNCFSAGSDIKEIQKDGISAIQNKRRMEHWAVIEATHIPIVAAVSGVCFGGGHELVMLCDVVIASENAIFGQPEIKLGHIPGDGATQRLSRLVGKYAAMKMILTGEPVDADTALSLGLASEVICQEDYETRAKEIAELIARHSGKALGYAKEAINTAYELPLSLGLERERQNIKSAFLSSDQKEGLAAFIEKRKPNFKDE